MATPDFAIKQNTNQPILQATLLRGDGSVQDLTGGTVLFRMDDASGQAAVASQPCVIVAPATQGIVQYVWQVSDTDVAGTFRAEFIVTLPGGAILRWPTFGWLTIDVEAQLP